jgi:hypothetical protein
MDQGGTTWARPDWVQVDMAGLVDIAMAHHNYGQRAFIEEYVFEEHPPTFAHVHGWWAQYSAFKTYPQWRGYFELPPNPDLPPAPPKHDGMWANRALLFAPEWPHDGTAVPFADGVRVDGLFVPTDAWAAGGDGFFEVGVASPPRAEGDDVRMVAFLAKDGAVVASWDLALGYALLGMDEWRADEVFVGRYAVPVRAEVAAGTYDLGVVLLDRAGPLARADAVDLADEPVYAVGEVRWAGAVRVAPKDEVDAIGAKTRAEAVELAAAGSCAEAEDRWVLAKRYRPRAWRRNAADRPPVARAIADCWATAAEQRPEDAPALLAKAHRWDHHSPVLARVGAPVGDRLWDEGMAARRAGDAETAYRRFTALLAFEPWRAWARRYAEEARDIRLDLDTTAVYEGPRPARPGAADGPDAADPPEGGAE